jgi:Cu/Ag efflux pump CusA
MKPVAAPIIGGMITSAIHVLIVTPVIFYMMNLRHCAGESPEQGSVLRDGRA